MLNAAKDSRAIRLTDPSRDPAGVFLLWRRDFGSSAPAHAARHAGGTGLYFWFGYLDPHPELVEGSGVGRLGSAASSFVRLRMRRSGVRVRASLARDAPVSDRPGLDPGSRATRP